MTNYLLRAVSIVFLVLLVGCAGRSFSGYSEFCKVADEREIALLFDRWNGALQSGDPYEVVANYAEPSMLLPTVSNIPRVTASEKVDYFKHFLENHPIGRINFRLIEIGCNSAVDSGLYTFTFGSGVQVPARYTFTYVWDGREWLISSHHSSAMPEK